MLAVFSPFLLVFLLAVTVDHPDQGDLQLARTVCRRIAESYDADPRPPPFLTKRETTTSVC